MQPKKQMVSKTRQSRLYTSAVVVHADCTPKLFKKHGKRAVMLAGSCIAIAGCVLGLIGSRNAILVFVATALNGLGLAPYVSGLFTFAPDIIEYFERKSGARYEGLVTAVNSVGIKIGTGLASAFIGWGIRVRNMRVRSFEYSLIAYGEGTAVCSPLELE
mgnify:CR=1 FL=1